MPRFTNFLFFQLDPSPEKLTHQERSFTENSITILRVLVLDLDV